MAVDCHRAAAVKGRLTPGAVSSKTSVARGTRRHHRLSLPAGKHAKRTLLLPVPQAVVPLHFQSRLDYTAPQREPAWLGGAAYPVPARLMGWDCQLAVPFFAGSHLRKQA